MTQKEFYKEQIFEIACSGEHIAVDKKTNKPCICTKINCCDCEAKEKENEK